MAEKETVIIGIHHYNELRDFKKNIIENGYLLVRSDYIPYGGYSTSYVVLDGDLKEIFQKDIDLVNERHQFLVKSLEEKHKEEVKELKKELEDVKSSKWWKFLF